MKIISNVPIKQINTYKEMLRELKNAFGNNLFWGESVYSVNDEYPDSIIIEGDLYKWYDEEKDISSKIEIVFMVRENKIENVGFKIDVFYEHKYKHKDKEPKDKQKYIADLKDKYDFAIMFMKVTPLKLYRLICVLFAEELKVNTFLYENDKLEFYLDDIFLQSLREE